MAYYSYGNQIRDRETRLNGDKIYNFNCRTERFKNSPIVFAIDMINTIRLWIYLIAINKSIIKSYSSCKL